MVFNFPKAATQHHNHCKIAVLWCNNDDMGQGNNNENQDWQIKDLIKDLITFSRYCPLYDNVMNDKAKKMKKLLNPLRQLYIDLYQIT